MKGYKTYIVAAGAILTAVGGYLTHTVDLGTAIDAVITALLAAGLRDAISRK